MHTTQAVPGGDMISATTSILTEINFNRIVKLVNRTGRYQLHLPQSSHVPGQAIGNLQLGFFLLQDRLNWKESTGRKYSTIDTQNE